MAAGIPVSTKYLHYNLSTVPDRFPLPNMHSLYDCMAG
jgi:hypothetical protein